MTDEAGRDPEREYRVILHRARADPQVVGVVVFGSRGAGAYVTDVSDVDAFVVVDGPSDAVKAWRTPHGSSAEIWPISLEAFRTHALPGEPDTWNRPTFLRTRIDLDKLGGEIGRIVDRKRRLDPDEATKLADEALDGYINSLYRALRNLEGGRLLESRLDAIESIGPLLTAAFALEGRVRPFNKWLRLEVEEQPLALPGSRTVLERIEAIVADPTADNLRAAFREIEPDARATGHGAIVDSWEPDLAWLRGTTPYRP